MLVLSRKVDESVLFPKYGIEVLVTCIEPGRVKLGITAPADVSVIRNELADVWIYSDESLKPAGGPDQ